MVLDEQNIKESEAGSISKFEKSSIIKKKGLVPPKMAEVQKKVTDPDEEDDDDLFSINLLAVSKISKEK